LTLGLLFLFKADSSYITLLLVLECLIIYILSLVLKENHFMYLSLLGLTGCLIRLLISDLSNSGTITRALVFIGVGLIMILMYGLNNHFRSLIKNPEKEA